MPFIWLSKWLNPIHGNLIWQLCFYLFLLGRTIHFFGSICIMWQTAHPHRITIVLIRFNWRLLCSVGLVVCIGPWYWYIFYPMSYDFLSSVTCMHSCILYVRSWIFVRFWFKFSQFRERIYYYIYNLNYFKLTHYQIYEKVDFFLVF